MTNKTKKDKYYYSTYIDLIYQQKNYDFDSNYYQTLEGKNNSKTDDSKVSDKLWWELVINIRVLIIVLSAIIFSLLFGAQNNQADIPDRFLIDVVVGPPNAFDIQGLQISKLSNKVNSQEMFTAFMKNINSEQFSQQLANSALYYPLLKIRRGIEVGERDESALISIEAEKPEEAQQWLSSFLTFTQQSVLTNYIDEVKSKLSDTRDKIQLEIDKIYQEASLESQAAKNKIARYEKAAKKAKEKGIINKVLAKNLTQEQHLDDLLYLQGYWRLEAQVKYLKFVLSRQIVDIASEQQTLSNIRNLIPSINRLKVFNFERELSVTDLTDRDSQQSVWSSVGAVFGAILGWILSRLFRRVRLKQ